MQYGLDKPNQLTSELSCSTIFIFSKSQKKFWEKNDRKQFFVILETFKVEEEESEYHLKICEYTLTNMSCFFIYIIS